MNIAEKLRFYRKEKYLTQKKLAELSNIAPITLQQYELGKRTPKIDNLQKIANALEVDINCLLEDTESPLIRAINDSESDSPLFDAVKQRKLTESVEFAPIDVELIKLFHQLNEKGQEKVIEYTSDLSDNQNYKGTP